MLPDEIKKMRAELHLSQEKLAQLLGVSYTTLNRWENGLAKPSPLAIDKLQQLSKQMKEGK